MVRSYLLKDGRLEESAEPHAQILLYTDPSPEEKAVLVGTYGIDEHTLNSALDPEELSRIEFADGHCAVIIKRPKRYESRDNFTFKVSSIGLFLYGNRLVIVTHDEDLTCVGRLMVRMQTLPDVLLKFMFSCMVHFEEHLRVIRRISDELEAEINQAVTNKDLLHMFKVEKSLVYYLDAIHANNTVAEKMRGQAQRLGLSPAAMGLIDDLIIEGGQCYQQADSYSQVLSSLMDAWASIINNNLNVRLKRLTVVSICIMTPTFVVSLFSMNLPLPLPHEGTISFWIVTGMAALSVLILLAVGYLKKL